MGKKRWLFSSVLVIFSVGLVIYSTAARIGFVNNDWYYIGLASQLDLPTYLAQYFDPRLQTGWYRPFFGILYLVVYSFGGADATAHHLVHIVLHAITSVLLFLLVRRVSHNFRMGLIAGLLYVGLPVYSKAVYWPSVPDPLSMALYLLSVWFWIDYLESGKYRFAIVTFVIAVLSLLTKEASVTLPIVLLSVDLLLIRRAATFRDRIYSYAPYIPLLVIYLLIEYSIQHNGSYVSMANYGFGPHVFSNLIDALALVAFPWDLGSPGRYIWLGVTVVAFFVAMASKRRQALIFLAIFTVLNLIPMLGFPTEWFETRYLYTPTMSTAILIGCLCEYGWQRAKRQPWFAICISIGIVGVLLSNYVRVTQASFEWGEIARQRRIPFRPIMQQHSSFPEGTLLYFIDTANVPFYDLSVMLSLRYGKGVRISGVAENKPANLRDYPWAYLYYFGSGEAPIEIIADTHTHTRSSLPSPSKFAVPIQLEGYEVAKTRLQHGEPLVVLLYWRAVNRIDQDYTVFMHLIDENGMWVAGYDSQPRGGILPTSQWEVGHLIVDWIILPIDSDIPANANYHLILGLYYLPTMERVWLTDENGQPLSDHLVIQTFHVEGYPK